MNGLFFMKISRNDLGMLKDESKRMYDLCQSIIDSQTFTREPLFSGYSDYVDSLASMHEHPEEFFVFRCFDCFVQVVYHSKRKAYGIYIEGCYSPLLNSYERLSSKSYVINDVLDFVLQVFFDVCTDVFKQKFAKVQDGLF